MAKTESDNAIGIQVLGCFKVEIIDLKRNDLLTI